MSFQQSLPVLLLPLIPPCVWVWIPSVLALPLWHSSHTYLFCTRSIRWKWSQHHKVLGFQLISATAESRPLFDAADRSGFVCWACPRLCQIKGQRLDGEATLLFILVQPRERPNKSGGNVVTGEPERSLPTGRWKWRDCLSLKSSHLHVFFFSLISLLLNVTFKTGSADRLFWDHL